MKPVRCFTCWNLCWNTSNAPRCRLPCTRIRRMRRRTLRRYRRTRPSPVWSSCLLTSFDIHRGPWHIGTQRPYGPRVRMSDGYGDTGEREPGAICQVVRPSATSCRGWNPRLRVPTIRLRPGLGRGASDIRAVVPAPVPWQVATGDPLWGPWPFRGQRYPLTDPSAGTSEGPPSPPSSTSAMSFASRANLVSPRTACSHRTW